MNIRCLNTVLMIFMGVALICVDQAVAGKTIDSPAVNEHVLVTEISTVAGFDSRDNENRGREFEFAFNYGIHHFWMTELSGKTSRETEEKHYQFESVEWKNGFQFLEQEKHGLGAGVSFAYATTVERKTADSMEGKILLEKTLGRFTHDLNFILAKEVGGGSQQQTSGALAWGSRYHWKSFFEPGIEMYSDFGEWKQKTGFNKQNHQLGPAFYGKIGEFINFDIGYLFGLTDPAPQGELKWTMGYEFIF